MKRVYEKGNTFLIFIFTGKLSQKSAEEACEAWDRLVMSETTTSFVNIWDCKGMTGFDQLARKKWMDGMDKMHNRTGEIWLIADSIIVRGAARLMTQLSKHQLKAFKNTDEMEEWMKGPKNMAIAC